MAENQLKIGTWNLCLGLSNKKDIITSCLSSLGVEICCLQETEIPMGFPENILNSGEYNVELELNTEKKRVGIYLHNKLKYARRIDLEKENHHIVIIDVMASKNFRLINL